MIDVAISPALQQGRCRVPVEWQTVVVFPIFKVEDWRVCYNHWSIPLLSLP